MEEMRITARRTDAGEYEFQAYDAETLFRQATELLNRRRCPDAVVLYDRLAREFGTSRYLSAALYNAGLCLEDTGQFAPAADHFAALLARVPRSSDVKDASFKLASVQLELERFTDAVTTADRLLEREDLTPDERVEAMARRAQGLLGAGQIDEAERQARAALSYYRTRPEDTPVRDVFFAAAANFVLADAIRRRGEAMAFPQGGVEVQRPVLVRRAELILQAQTEYFNAIRFTNAYWASAAGYRIGSMYDTFWNAITSAPVPPRPDLNDADRRLFGEEYRRELTNMVKPLLRHAIRYWELTLMMVERTGVRSPWADRTRQDLDRVREVLIQQGPGLGGLPPAPPTPPETHRVVPSGRRGGARTSTQAQ